MDPAGRWVSGSLGVLVQGREEGREGGREQKPRTLPLRGSWLAEHWAGV